MNVSPASCSKCKAPLEVRINKKTRSYTWRGQKLNKGHTDGKLYCPRCDPR